MKRKCVSCVILAQLILALALATSCGSREEEPSASRSSDVGDGRVADEAVEADQAGEGEPAETACGLRLTRIYRKQVGLLFKGYIVKAGGDPAVIDPAFWIVALNCGLDPMTRLVRLGDTWHGYKVGPLEKKKVRRTDRHGRIPDWFEDVYVLTIQRPGEDPIKLERGRWVVVEVLLVDLEVARGVDAGAAVEGKTVGDTVTVSGIDYTITELHDEAVTVKDDKGREYTLR